MCSRLRAPSSEYSTGARFGRSRHRSNRRQQLPVGLPTDVGEVFLFCCQGAEGLWDPNRRNHRTILGESTHLLIALSFPRSNPGVIPAAWRARTINALADGARTLGGSFATAAFNVGAAMGPVLGGLAIGMGLSYRATALDERRAGDTRDRHRRSHLVSVAASSVCPRICPRLTRYQDLRAR